ncbi:developmental and secondary metabolism regulator VEL1-like [Oryza brachyantha]|uniref:developmental and secondary metabolism regulator VEL1-like n=1 Tax=Oryza brachyantha TaxID=4533 RepID=UPI0003EA8151|nr:developmental and secondary metabolism regulator VEL1-like [Oryza brachyantha]
MPRARRARRTGSAYVDDERERDITFFKRRNGLFKGASDLSILTGASVAVVLEDQNRGKFHSLGTPLVQTVVDAALSRDMEPTEPFAGEQLKGRLVPLERELARLKDVAAIKEEETRASKARYNEAKKEEEDDDERDALLKKLFFSKQYNLSLDEMNELYEPPPFVADQAPPPPPPAAGGSLWIPELPPPPPAGSPWARVLPLQPPRFSEMEPIFHASQQAPAQDNTQLAPLPPVAAPLPQHPFLLSDHAPALGPVPASVPLQMPVEAHFPLESPLFHFHETFLVPEQAQGLAPLPAPLQMPMEAHMPMEDPLFQEPFLVPDQAPVLSPLPMPLQMPVEAHMPLEAPWFQEPIIVPDQAPMLSPLPAPLQMPVDAHFPLAAEAVQQQTQGYENYDFMFDNAGLSQPLVAGAGNDGDAAMGNDNPLGYQQWAASPLYDGQIYFGTGVDDMGIIVGDHGGVLEADMVEGGHASSSGGGDDIAGGAWF